LAPLRDVTSERRGTSRRGAEHAEGKAESRWKWREEYPPGVERKGREFNGNPVFHGEDVLNRQNLDGRLRIADCRMGLPEGGTPALVLWQFGRNGRKCAVKRLGDCVAVFQKQLIFSQRPSLGGVGFCCIKKVG
jgi:hypothetical protein